MKLLIVGCGYVGSQLVRQLRDESPRATVYALTRSAERVVELRALGVEPIVGDWLDSSSLSGLDALDIDHVLVAVPHRPVDPYGVSTHRHGLINLSNRLREKVTHWVYLSTTGVYGECDNEIVDELTPPSPSRIGPEIAVDAERWLVEQRASGRINATTLRLAGIYGPGRIPLAGKLKAGEPLAVPRDGYLNLVHCVDIARMIMKVLASHMQRPCYVFSDGNPVLRELFYRTLAHQCGISEPTFVDPDPSDSKVRRATNKKVNPNRLVAETQFVYLFPDYQAGLADAIQNE